MATDTTIQQIPPDPNHLSPTAGDIHNAFWAAMGALEGAKAKVTESAQRFAYAGKLLERKNEELGRTKAALADYLAANVPDISIRTAYRLMAIYRASVRSDTRSLPENLTSIREIYDALTSPKQPASAATSTGPIKTVDEKPTLKKWINGFWRSFAKCPPSLWEPAEQSSFLLDLAKRERIRREHGWELPPIEIEVEEVK